MGKLIYIMGKSASGKDKIYRHLARKEELALRKIVLYTTRPIRENEQDGVSYWFVTEERLKELEAQGRVIERRDYRTVHGIWSYATVDDDSVKLSEADYIAIGTLESYEKMISWFGTDKVVPIYIELEDGIRLSRALGREQQQKTPHYAEMCRRFLADAEDFSEEKLLKAGIVKRFENMDADQTAGEIVNYIREASGRVE